MRTIVREAVTDLAKVPYGLIVAGACDVSAETMAAFHDERSSLGVREGHLWVRGHLEDMLFRPENDNLLFAYFGISLGTLRRSALQRVQASLTAKRKILPAYKAESIKHLAHVGVMIRDVEDLTYPNGGPVDGKDVISVRPWFGAEIYKSYNDGLMVRRHTFRGWIKPDGTWDLLEISSHMAGHHHGMLRWEGQTDESQEWNILRHEQANKVMSFVSLEESAGVDLISHLPYSSILEVDGIGDSVIEGVHLFCRSEGIAGPFVNRGLFHSNHMHAKVWLDIDLHRRLFPELISKLLDEGDLQESDLTTVWPLLLKNDPENMPKPVRRAKKRRK